MRKGLLLSFLLISLIVFSGCKPIWTEKIVADINKNSNLEIELLTPAEDMGVSDFGIMPGFGITGYYDKKYGDEEIDPDSLYKCYVRYDVTSYPDVLLGEQCVTGIYITDPSIFIYGYSVGDSSKDFSNYLKDKGFKEYYTSNRLVKFSKGKVELRCGINYEAQAIDSLYVGVTLTNSCGVIF